MPADPPISTDPAAEGTTPSDLDALKSAASDPALSEDLALTLLKRSDLSPETLEAISKNANILRNRKVKLAVLEHPRTPRHVSLPMVRSLFTFDLMRVTLTAIVPADIRRAADDVLIHRLETITSGERLSLARRGSGNVAGALLLDKETRVMRVALENSRLTETALIKALTRSDSSAALVEAVCRHEKWSTRREVRVALLRNAKTPMARALEFARSIPANQLREILNGSHLPHNIQSYLRNQLEK